MLDQLLYEEAGACALDYKKRAQRKETASKSKTKKSDSTANHMSQHQLSQNVSDKSYDAHSAALNHRHVLKTDSFINLRQRSSELAAPEAPAK